MVDRDTRLAVWAPKYRTGLEPGNETSVLTKVSMQGVSFLLTGDAGRDEIHQLMDEEAMDVKCTVLKFPHHGSKYSWSDRFIEETRARYVVMSVGANNPFGHPDPQVIKKLQDKNIQVLRTDRDGAITFTTDGRTLRIKKFSVPPRSGAG